MPTLSVPRVDSRAATALLVMGDFGDERCGVGSSDSLVVAGREDDVRVVDPVGSSLGDFTTAVRTEAAGVAGAVLVYPTLSQVAQADLVPKALALRRILGRGRWIRVHLHEFDRLDRRQRAGVALVLGLVADRIVVSSAAEVAALRRHHRGLAARRAELVVVPPANPSAPSAAEVEVALSAAEVAAGRTVGVHGQYRPDKGIDWLLATLARLDRRFTRLEIAGRGWSAAPWPRSLLDRLQVVDHGQTPRRDLPATLGAWDLALAPFDGPPTDGRNSLRTPLALGVPTLTRGPRPPGMRLAPPHLRFDDEVDLGAIPQDELDVRRAGAAEVAALEAAVLRELADVLFGP